MWLNEKKINKLFLHWLFCTLLLIYLTILIGGLTRLTNSGLSITEWELFKGVLPPLDNYTWMSYFDQYKKIPQFKILNFDMSLSEFKVIFYWEYVHRIIGRLIGLFFLFPLIIFYLSKKIKKKYLNICFLILILIIFQGFVGWYMVKSGLQNDITVSHYRLSLHLTTAIFIISIIFWLIKNVASGQYKIFFEYSNNNLLFQILIFIIFFQVIIGAFVSGLDAGKIYQTWPLMGESYFPNDLLLANYQNFFEFSNHSLVQFYHRNLAYIIIFYVLFLSLYIFKKKIYHLYKALIILLLLVILQVFLGVFTLVSGLNIYLASAHQFSSVLLIFGALNLYYLKAK